MTGYSKFRYGGSTVHTFEFNQVRYRPKLVYGRVGLEKLSKMALDAVAKINCGFFDASSEHHGLWSDDWTTVCYDDLGEQTFKFYDPETMEPSSFDRMTKENTLVLGAAFTLVENGTVSIRNTEPFPHWNQRHPRTILAQRQNRNILFIVVDGRKSWRYRVPERGMTAKEAANLCIHIGVRCAVTFDGGGSSEMMVGSQIMNRPSDGGERHIGTCLAAFVK